MGYLVCDECEGYYQLQPGENPEDFDLVCDCGGKLFYSKNPPIIDEYPTITENINSKTGINCPVCGIENMTYSKYCQECGTSFKEDSSIKHSRIPKKGIIMDWFNQKPQKTQAAMGLAIICCIGLILIIGVVGSFSSDKTTSTTSTGPLNDTAVKTIIGGGSEIRGITVQGGDVLIIYDLGFVNDNDDIVIKSSQDSIRYMEKLFKDKRVTAVTVISSGTFTDQYGNDNIRDAVRIRISRVTADQINWDGVGDRLYSDPANFLRISESYSINPSVYNKLTFSVPISK